MDSFGVPNIVSLVKIPNNYLNKIDVDIYNVYNFLLKTYEHESLSKLSGNERTQIITDLLGNIDTTLLEIKTFLDNQTGYSYQVGCEYEEFERTHDELRLVEYVLSLIRVTCFGSLGVDRDLASQMSTFTLYLITIDEGITNTCPPFRVFDINQIVFRAYRLSTKVIQYQYQQRCNLVDSDLSLAFSHDVSTHLQVQIEKNELLHEMEIIIARLEKWRTTDYVGQIKQNIIREL